MTSSVAPESPNQRADAAWVALAREHLALGRPLVVRASGLSMWPFLRPGQRVVVEPRRPLSVGDLALVELGGSLVLHRVIGLSGSRLVSKGDHNPRPDPELDRAAVLGSVSGGRLGTLVARLSKHGGAPLATLSRKVRLALRDRL